MRTSVWLAGTITTALVLAGCSGTPETGTTTETPAVTETAPSVDPTEVTSNTERIVETRTIPTDGSELEVRVHALVQAGEYVVLTVDLIPAQIRDGSEWISSSIFQLKTAAGTLAPAGAQAPAGLLRLVDAESLSIHLPALDQNSKPIGTSSGSFVIKPEGVRVQQVYAAPKDGDSLGLLLPGHFITDLPVDQGEVPAPTLDGDSGAEPLDLGKIVVAPVEPLGSISRQLEGAVQVIESTEEVRIDLQGDVLFEVDSAELGAEASTMISAAAKTLNARGSGQLSVVGHTDSIADDAYNQKLSEQRANAVAQALGQQIDTVAFEIATSGRGESEPIAPNDSDANRQLNRRVTLTLITEDTTRSEIPATGELPPFDKGPVAMGAQGFEDTESVDTKGAFHVSAPAAYRVGGLLVVSIEAERTDSGKYNDSWAINLSAGHGGYRGQDADMGQWPFSARLLVGDTAIYPLDYMIGVTASNTELFRVAGDNDLQQSAAGGQILRFVALYPDVPGAQAINLENSGPAWSTNFRLTDIPVE